MTPERWQKVKEIFNSAIQHEPADRAAFLSQSCSGDEALRKEVESLLASHDKDGSFIDSPAYQAAAELLVNEKAELKSGQTFGSYEIVSFISRGGMGEVYLAQDKRLGRRVALKLLPSSVTKDVSRLRRFEQEARSASALNHPNIITIHEIREANSTLMIATEFVEGETLRQRLGGGALNLSESLQVAIQIADALAAAHKAGIIHRDIKPENIMIRPDGYVKVLDFGLAKLIEPVSPASIAEAPTKQVKTGSGMIIGTVGYMSPEQARGQTVDARSDIFNLGAVLYEMVAGQTPFEGETPSDVLAAILKSEPPLLSHFAPEVPPELVRIVTKALRKDREQRYQVVKDMLLDLKSLKEELEFQAKLDRSAAPSKTSEASPTISQSQSLTTEEPLSSGSEIKTAVSTITHSLGAEIKRHKFGVLLALAALVIIAISGYFYVGRHSVLGEKDTILLADFVNTTGDANFDGTLKQALAVQLRQTPFVNLFPEESVRETLRYMGRSEDDHITRQIGREICQRRGLKALLVGTIAGLGKNYVITLEAINGQTGTVIASQQVEAEGKEQVLKSLGQAALDLRKQLGESMSTLQKYNAPIEQATTSSLEALQAYSKARELWTKENAKEAIIFYERAIEFDPNFAAAYEWSAWAYLLLGESQKADEAAHKAFALRDKLTERERFSATDTYYYVTRDWLKEEENDQLWARLYPNDWVAHIGLAIIYNSSGRFEKAAAESAETIRCNPSTIQGYRGLVVALMHLGRFAEARKVARQAQDAGLDNSLLRETLYEIAFAENDQDAMRQHIEATRKSNEREASLEEARVALFRGRWREAETLYRSAGGRSGRPHYEGTVRSSLFGPCRSEDATLTLDISRFQKGTAPLHIQVPILPDGSLCGDSSNAQRFVDEFVKRYPAELPVNAMTLPPIRAAIELQRNQPERAIEFLKLVLPYDGSDYFQSDYLRAQAYLRAHRYSEAVAEFQKILDHRGWGPVSHFYSLSYLGLARALALNGEATGSRKAYQDFFALWKDADADLPILIEAKKESEKLK